MPSRRWWLRWIGWGLVGCAAGVLAVGAGMGVAAGVPFVGLALGLWAAWSAWHRSPSREQVLPLSLWGGLVSAGLAAHFVFLGELGLLLLLGPQEASRPILGELTGAGLGFLRRLVPPLLDSVGAFWIIQTLVFGGLELGCGLLGAWVGAKALLAREARLARWIERTWDRLPKWLEAGLIVGGTAAALSVPLFIVSRGLPLAHLLLAAPVGALAGWLTQRWAVPAPSASPPSASPPQRGGSPAYSPATASPGSMPAPSASSPSASPPQRGGAPAYSPATASPGSMPAPSASPPSASPPQRGGAPAYSPATASPGSVPAPSASPPHSGGAPAYSPATAYPGSQVTLAGLLAGLLAALSVVAIFALFTVAGPAGRTTLSAAYADVGDASRLIPHWLDPLWIAFPVLSGLFTLIITGLAVGGALGSRRRARRGALES